MEVFKVSPRNRAQQRFMEQIHADFPVPHGRVGGRGLQGFLPGQGSTASSSSSHVPAGSAEEAVSWVFFALFPGRKKKCGVGSALGVRTGVRTLFNPWTPAAYAESMHARTPDDEAVEESEAAVAGGGGC